ncbi:hypothetical protein NM688_g7163 [Phlebia brevispora]|uniref:Uncharacterized protein n=1 Tax=Phlebia brevispora TaxID=194682 RepID=A0ACC1S8H4_9APHY|nr:hypothetical protein NM688_g7163 [Phlebia brevispora]
MNLFRLFGDLSHLASILILLQKIYTTRSCRGISFKTQALYATVFISRYLDLFEWVSLYNFVMKVFFIASSVYILYLMKYKFRPTQDPSIDTFRVEYLVGPAVLLSLIFNYKFTFKEILWSFSIFLESVAILPQLFMLQRTGEAETITTHYLAALGIYRALYIPNWIYRYWTEGVIDPIAVIAGLVQTALYLDFFYVYVTNVPLTLISPDNSARPGIRMLLGGLLWSTLALLPLGVLGALDDSAKLANRTIERTVALRTHSIYAPYIDQDLQNRWWDFGADAIINTNKHIRLTRNRPSQTGWLWSRLPISAPNYVIDVEFKISGESSHLFGDGMAIWLTVDRAQPGPVFGSIDKFTGLGIFLDTYANARHGFAFPRVVGMLGDGKTAYDQAHDGEKNKIGACSANFRRTNVATKLRITYIKDELLKVQIQYKAWDDWTDCFVVDKISLPEKPYLGFSALTGDVSDNHDIISVTTSTAVLSSPDAPRDKFRSNMKTTAESSWLWTFAKIGLFVAFVAGALYGYKIYALRQAGGKGFGIGRVPGVGGGLYPDAKRF